MRTLEVWMTVASVATATAAQAQDVGKGLELALEVCGACHAVIDGQLESPLTTAPSFEDVAATPGMTAAALNVWLTAHDHPTMPNIVLTQDDVRDMSAYILSLKD